MLSENEMTMMKALMAIRKHQEVIVGNGSRMSATWQIADNAIRDVATREAKEIIGSMEEGR